MKNIIRCRKGFIGIEVAIAAALSLAAVSGAMRYPLVDNTAASHDCVTNMKIIQEAKEEWALDNNYGSSACPAWFDLAGPDKYIDQPNSMPVFCPSGGDYTIGDMYYDPCCSIGDTVNPPHKLP